MRIPATRNSLDDATRVPSQPLQTSAAPSPPAMRAFAAAACGNSSDHPCGSVADGMEGDADERRAGAAVSATTASCSPPATHTNRRNISPRLTEQVRCFAALAGLSECLRLHPAAPLGYFMDAPSAGLGEDSQRGPRECAWWLLALLSGQLDEVITLGEPDHSGQHHPVCGAPDRGFAAAPCPAAAASALRDGLLDPHDEAAAAFSDLVVLIRTLRQSAPPPRAPGEEAVRGRGA